MWYTGRAAIRFWHPEERVEETSGRTNWKPSDQMKSERKGYLILRKLKFGMIGISGNGELFAFGKIYNLI
ncbi:hypothetical protein GCM10011571_09250 [Marinithermofilum abyssi]|uniref:Uncharacterized protein n=1 Tax=Marinithermofilum abyssi TaxID=1571185 RepID=A0A8J2VDF9_9BACL|nr:hypothetical protein GCM10011571_09250 [Marinithermofilum abyssi]